LVVDDNVDAAESLATLLDVWGHETRVAHDGARAMALARDFQPEVALLDIGLPDTNGYELASELRRTAGLEGTLLIALTGYGQEQDQKRAREVGFSHHLVKPANFKTIQKLLAEFDGSSS